MPDISRQLTLECGNDRGMLRKMPNISSNFLAANGRAKGGIKPGSDGLLSLFHSAVSENSPANIETREGRKNHNKKEQRVLGLSQPHIKKQYVLFLGARLVIAYGSGILS